MSDDKSTTDHTLSRRGFITTAVAGGAAIAAGGAAAEAASSRPKAEAKRHEDPLEERLTQYGSEFGDIKQIQTIE